MPHTIRFQGALTASSVENRTVAGTLLPFGEQGRTSAGRLTAAASVVTWPQDVQAVVLNLGHDRNVPVGRASSITETPTGLLAEFDVADVPAGNQLLAEVAAGLRRGLSVELDEIAIKDGQLTAGRLTHVGAVVDPAFPSALVAADTPDAPDRQAGGDQLRAAEDEATSTTTVDCPVCASSIDLDVAVLGDTTATAPAPTCPNCGSWLTVATPGAPDPEPSLETPMPVPAEALANRTPTTGGRRLAATAPAGAHRGVVGRPRMNHAQAAQLVAAAAHGRLTGPQLTAALSDVVVGPANGGLFTTMSQDSWLGELWDGRDYARKFVPLVGSGPVTGLKVVGWRWVERPVMDDYAGNKTEVPSNPVSVEAVEATVTRLAGAWDIDRAFWDLGSAAFIDSFWRMTVDSYARESDARAAAAIRAAAAANTVTSPAAGAGVSRGLAAIADGALWLLARPRPVSPTFALVATDLWRDILLTRSDDALAYLNASLGLEDGSAAAFQIQPDPGLTPGTVKVGAKEGLTFYELGTTPVRVDAEDVSRGGRDIGAFGYTASIVNNDDAFVTVTTA